jgi:hypothetical protein
MNRSGCVLGLSFLAITAACAGASNDDPDVDIATDLSSQAKPKKDAGTGSGADTGTDTGTDSGRDGGADTGTPAPSYDDACLMPGMTEPPLIPYGYISADAQDEGASAAIPLPFAFSYFGASQSHYWVASNGELGFGTDARGPNFGQVRCPLPDSQLTRPIVFGYALDLMAGRVCVATKGTAPNRKLVVTWKDKFAYENTGMNVTFGVTLSEGTNAIDLRVHQVNLFFFDLFWYNGFPAVLGMQRGASAASFSCFQGLAAPGTAYHYQP